MKALDEQPGRQLADPVAESPVPLSYGMGPLSPKTKSTRLSGLIVALLLALFSVVLLAVSVAYLLSPIDQLRQVVLGGTLALIAVASSKLAWRLAWSKPPLRGTAASCPPPFLLARRRSPSW